MDPQLQEFLTALVAVVTEARALGLGPWALAISVVVGTIRLWQKPLAQDLARRGAIRFPLLRWLVWDELPIWAKFLVPFIGALGTGAMAVWAGTTSWLLAIVGAVGVGVAAILTHHGTKAAGAALTPLTVKLPTPARHAASLVLPIDPSRVPPRLPG